MSLPKDGAPIDDETRSKLAEENADRGPQPDTGAESKPPAAPKPKTAKAAGAAAAPKSYGDYKPLYKDIGDKPHGFFKRLNWTRKLLRERRKLRKDLKSRGIKKYRDFDNIAREVGLGLDRNSFIGWFWWKWVSLANLFGLKGLFITAGLLAAGLFTLSFLTDYAGSFTINMTADMIKNGFILCETGDLAEPKSRLFSDEVTVNNITVDDLPRDLDEIDGCHNGKSYLAMTFYLSNSGENINDVIYTLQMKSSMFDVDKAVWIMLYVDGKQIIYAQPNSNGKEERLYGYRREPPFIESAYDPELQYYQKEDGRWGIATTMFEDDNIVVRGVMMEVEPGETHKFTVVLWLEGWDPECVNALQGGFAKYEMDFDIIEPAEAKRGIFDGVFRTEYEDYMSGKYQKQQEEANPTATVTPTDDPNAPTGEVTGTPAPTKDPNDPNGNETNIRGGG